MPAVVQPVYTSATSFADENILWNVNFRQMLKDVTKLKAGKRERSVW
jgi:hypothetical protein